MEKKRILLLAVALTLMGAVAWMIWGNVTVGLTAITVTEENLPVAFDGFRIAHVSDLHNSRLWEKTISQLKTAKPDIICITGDLIDCKRTDLEAALSFAAEAVTIAPCYYITGNHEFNLPSEERDALLRGLSSLNVTVLIDNEIRLEKQGQQIALAGHQWGKGEGVGELSDFEGYRILLDHRPEHFADFVAAGYDLVLCGHAHGGQVRIPFLGGLFAPGQGILPKYDSGHYSQGQTDMIVSRGIGNSSFPIRFNNRPEVILLLLRTV